VDDQALGLQLHANEIFAAGVAVWGNDQVSRMEWFQRARSLLTKDLCQVDAQRATAMGYRQIGLWFELQGPMEREARLKVLAGLLSGDAPPAVRAVGGRRAASSAQSLQVKNSRVRRPRTSPLVRERVQEAWARWLRRNRLW
jgi:hypothetical protein